MWQPIASNESELCQFECHSRTLAFPSMTWFGKKGVNSWMWIEWDFSHQPYESPFSSMNWHSQCCTFKDQFECQFKIELSGMCECWFHSELGTSLHHKGYNTNIDIWNYKGLKLKMSICLKSKRNGHLRRKWHWQINARFNDTISDIIPKLIFGAIRILS